MNAGNKAYIRNRLNQVLGQLDNIYREDYRESVAMVDDLFIYITELEASRELATKWEENRKAGQKYMDEPDIFKGTRAKLDDLCNVKDDKK